MAQGYVLPQLRGAPQAGEEKRVRCAAAANLHPPAGRAWPGSRAAAEHAAWLLRLMQTCAPLGTLRNAHLSSKVLQSFFRKTLGSASLRTAWHSIRLEVT